MPSIQRIDHDNQPCDCGAPARVRVAIRLGSASGHHYRDDYLALCAACYAEYLAVEHAPAQSHLPQPITSLAGLNGALP